MDDIALFRSSTEPSSRDLTLDDLCRWSWIFGPGDHDAVLGIMRFVPGGRIFGYDHMNERRWTFEDNVLHLFSDQGVCTSAFDKCDRVGSLFVLHSHLRLNDQERFFRLRQRNVMAEYDQHLEALHARDRLTDLRRPLVVIFNSGLNPYTGKAVAWEYLLTTLDPTVDYLRMAERSEPLSWYLKTSEKVKSRIRAAALGRRKVVLAGASSGGYAAIRFGEWLGEQGLVDEVVSISVNPQTVHSLPHRQFLWANQWDSFMPGTIADETLDFLDVKDVDLDGVLGRNRKGPVRHMVFHDAGNPVEEYYALCIKNCPGVELRPKYLGMSHGEGIHQMEQQGVMHNAIQAEIA